MKSRARRSIFFGSLLAALILSGKISAADEKKAVACDIRLLIDTTRIALEKMQPRDEREAFVVVHFDTRNRWDQPFGELYSDANIHVVEALSGCQLEPTWTVRRRLHSVNSGPRNILNPREVDPFTSEGQYEVILDVSKTATGVETLDAFLIPDSWAGFSRAAFEYAQANRASFSTAPDAKGLPAMVELLASDNPILSVGAARVLASDHKNLQILVNEISKSKGMRQAQLTLLLIRGSKPSADELRDVLNLLNEVIQHSRSTEDLHGVALAAYASAPNLEAVTEQFLLGTRDPSKMALLSSSERLQPLLLRRIRARFVELDPDLSDEYLSRLLGLWNEKRRGKI